MTQRRLAELVAKGELRYVLGGGGGFGGPGGGGGANVTGIVSQACTSVPASTWGGTSGTLYDCQGKADAIRTVEVRATAGGQGRVGANAGGQPPTGGQGFPGGGAGGAGGPGAPSAEVEACLQASGVSLPDPTSGGAPPALNDPTTMEAVQACFAAA
jgi:hypothetical protein